MPRRKGIRIPREVWLKSRPHRVTEEYYRNEDGNIVIVVQLEYHGIMGKLLKIFSITPPPKYKKYILDKVGSEIWKLCDGKHTIEDIIKRVMKITGLSRRNAELATYTYIRQLVEKGLIELIIPTPPGGGE